MYARVGASALLCDRVHLYMRVPIPGCLPPRTSRARYRFADVSPVAHLCTTPHLFKVVVHADADVVNDQLFEPLLGGFADTAKVLRELTLKSMLCLADK